VGGGPVEHLEEAQKKKEKEKKTRITRQQNSKLFEEGY